MQTSPGRSGLLLLVLSTLVGSLVPLVAHAASIEVNSLADPGTKGCDAAECTLREAIAAAQDGDTIRFQRALFANGPGTITLRRGALRINQNLILNGPGQQRLAISGNQRSRVFHIESGIVTITKVTIEQGYSPDTGGGLANFGVLTLGESTLRDNTADYHGGGLRNQGVLTLSQSTVSGNTTRFNGGGLDNDGELTLNESTVTDNLARYAGGGLNNFGVLTLTKSTVTDNLARYAGGGLANFGVLTVSQSTISGNTARNVGGGLFSIGVLTLSQSTVSGNIADYGGGLYNRTVLALYSTLILGNTARTADADCFHNAHSGTLQNHGYNLTGTDMGCPSNPNRGDLTVDPAVVFTQVLGPLQDNGGATFTHALRRRSPALDAADPKRCRGTDQRDVLRPQGARCDIGAFELEE
jgi:CSLREA domain-containing protein